MNGSDPWKGVTEAPTQEQHRADRNEIDHHVAEALRLVNSKGSRDAENQAAQVHATLAVAEAVRELTAEVWAHRADQAGV